MTKHRSLLAAASLLALAITPAGAVTLPVAEDTSTSAINGRLTIATGAATALSASPNQTALVRFDLSQLPGNIISGTVRRATLRVYVFAARAGTTGAGVFPVTSDWHENVVSVLPSVGPGPRLPFTTAPASKQFMSVDVTALVQDAIGSGGGFGFAITTTAGRIVLGSKEGPGIGYPAELEVEADQAGSFFDYGADAFFTVASAGVNGTLPANDRLAGINLSNFDNTYGFTIQSRDGVNSSGLEFINHEGALGGPVSLFIDRSSGNVGVGTTSPSSTLQVGDFAGSFSVNSGRIGNVTTTLRAATGDIIPLVVQIADGTTIAQFQDPAGNGTSFALLPAVGSQPGGGSWAIGSDRRLKKNIEPLNGALDRLLQLRSVSYEYLDPAGIHELPGTQIGFIAQEVEPVFPDWVGEKADGMKYLAVKGFESLTVQALRELRAEKDAEIAALKQKVAAFEARDAAREARLTRLESTLEDRPARAVRATLGAK